MSDNFLGPIEVYYSNKVREHGDTPKGVDWNGRESQSLRFEQLTRLVDGNAPFTLLDFGCGYGAYLDHLREANLPVDYTGIDIAEAMINAAQQRHAKDRKACFEKRDRPEGLYDYCVASGLFNVRLGHDAQSWARWIEQTLDVVDECSTRGFAFNALTSYSDADKMRDTLHYSEPEALFGLCKRKYSRHVSLLHDYGLYEFTILVRKQP